MNVSASVIDGASVIDRPGRHRPTPSALPDRPSPAASGSPGPDMVGLFHTLQALRTDARPFVLQFVAPHGAAGTTTIARGFAEISARTIAGGVLLVVAASDHEADADRAAAVPALLSPERAASPSSLALPGTDQPVAADPGCPGLWLARLAVNPGRALAPAQVQGCLDSLRQRFEIIVIDCAALDRFAQAAMLARFADGTALVVEAERTTRQQVLGARKTIEAIGGQLLGAVFTKAG